MSRPNRASALLALPMSLALVAAPPALADEERLEAELRALFAGQGRLEIGDVSGALLRDRVTAEALRFDSDEGERLLIDRYRVSGDYDRPDEVLVEGVRLEEGLTEMLLIGIERIVLGEPSRAVLPLGDEEAMASMRLGSLAVDGLVVELASALVAELSGEPMGEGRLSVARIRGEGISREAIDWLEIADVAGTGQDLDELGSGAFTLGRLRLEGLSGLDEEDAEELSLLELNDLAVEAERMVGSLARLRIDGDFTDGEGGVRVDELRLDLARMIELAPEEERTRLRMASNVLTDGSGALHLDAAFRGDWQPSEAHGVLRSDSELTLHDALRLALDIELPLVLPEDAEPAELFADSELLEAATLLGGEVTLILSDRGLFGRLATLGAALEGISEAQYLEQARTQAQGFGMMFGPQVQAFLIGLVELMEGSASELELAISLPAESNLETFTGDPLALPDRLSLRVETR
ncbi:hypothetical protein BDK63_000389 [Halomonas campaniensis]|uniref:DUF945 domain-containing protein n=1 Tax=Halomonas campaniensis TaxID=213554 RepID=A0A7W5K083_9GAMM|nr:hypothetical protein [Halomonas campaniensis]MBB3329549.1 hypothetical protein [Halomonas campaniensis]